MSKLSQGSQLFMIDPETDAVIEIECVTDFNPGGNPADQLDDTCLKDTTRKSKKGLRTPGQATAGLKPDPANASHVRLYELSESDADADQDLHFVLGWSDGATTIVPTVDSNGEFVLPTTRTWFKFDGFVGDFPMEFAIGQLVNSTVSIQRNGRGYWIVKTP